MASTNYVFFIIAVLTSLVATASSKEFTVGDGSGWTLGVDYEAWAEGKDFRVGDKLVFTHLFPVHNVLRVSGEGFQNCNVSTTMEGYISGNDTIVLSSPGRRWFICGIYGHCGKGMKLALTVKPAEAEAPISPSPVLSAMSYTSDCYKERIYHQLLITLVAIAMVILFI